MSSMEDWGLMENGKQTARRIYSRLLRLLPDSIALRVHYMRVQRRPLHLGTPSLFTEKIQWLKLYDRVPEKVICADKLRVRDYVAARLGPDHLIPLIATAEHPDELDFNSLGPKYMIKTNHGSGANVAVLGSQMWSCGRYEPINYPHIREVLRESLATDYSRVGREWEYATIPRRIVVEQLVSDDSGNTLLTDYKIHCFNGQALLVQVISDRAEGVKESWFDREWTKLPCHYFSEATKDVPRPPELPSLLESAEKLALGFTYVRVDLYSTRGRVLFGEMTFHPASGFMRWAPTEWDERLGRMLVLPTGG